jgi:hypothetical protein
MGSLGLVPEDLEEEALKAGPVGVDRVITLEAGSEYNVGDVIDAAGYGMYQHGLMFLCGAVWMADAMEMMLMSFLLPRVRQEWNLTDAEEADIMSE